MCVVELCVCLCYCCCCLLMMMVFVVWYMYMHLSMCAQLVSPTQMQPHRPHSITRSQHPHTSKSRAVWVYRAFLLNVCNPAHNRLTPNRMPATNVDSGAAHPLFGIFPHLYKRKFNQIVFKKKLFLS